MRPAARRAIPGTAGEPNVKKHADITVIAVNASSIGVSPSNSACGISSPAFAAVTNATAA